MKLSQLLSKEYLVSVLREKDDLMRFEYCGRQKQVFRLMTVVPISWDKKGMLEKAMCISQDIGEKHELETLANTDGLTGLFNERYFTMMLQDKEKKKLPFVLVYLNLDQFKPINDTYGHTMGISSCRKRRSASCCAFVKMTMYSASAAMNSRSSSAWISMSI